MSTSTTSSGGTWSGMVRLGRACSATVAFMVLFPPRPAPASGLDVLADFGEDCDPQGGASAR
jgi:hypothetical protein